MTSPKKEQFGIYQAPENTSTLRKTATKLPTFKDKNEKISLKGLRSSAPRNDILKKIQTEVVTERGIK